MYLKAECSLKVTMPSQNVENLMYEPSSTTASEDEWFLIESESETQKLESQSILLQKSNAIKIDDYFTKRPEDKQLTGIRSKPVSQANGGSKIQQCYPHVHLIDQNNSNEQLYQDLVDELRVNSSLSAQILCQLMDAFDSKKQNYSLG